MVNHFYDQKNQFIGDKAGAAAVIVTQQNARRKHKWFCSEVAHRLGTEHPILASHIGSLGWVRIPARDSNSVKMRT